MVSDWITLNKLILSGVIGTAFGLITAWVTYRFQRRRDNISWIRENKKLQQQFNHERDLLDANFQQRIKELEQKERERFRDELTKGLENPAFYIQQLLETSYMLKKRHFDTIQEIKEGKIFFQHDSNANERHANVPIADRKLHDIDEEQRSRDIEIAVENNENIIKLLEQSEILLHRMEQFIVDPFDNEFRHKKG